MSAVTISAPKNAFTRVALALLATGVLVVTAGCGAHKTSSEMGYVAPDAVRAHALNAKEEDDMYRKYYGGQHPVVRRFMGNFHGAGVRTSRDGDFKFGKSRSGQTRGIHYDRNRKYTPF